MEKNDNIIIIEPEHKTKEDRIIELLEENLAYAKQINIQTEKTRKYIFYGQVFSVIKLVLVLAPIIIGLIYVMPFLKGALDSYSSLLGIDINAFKQ